MYNLCCFLLQQKNFFLSFPMFVRNSAQLCSKVRATMSWHLMSWTEHLFLVSLHLLCRIDNIVSTYPVEDGRMVHSIYNRRQTPSFVVNWLYNWLNIWSRWFWIHDFICLTIHTTIYGTNGVFALERNISLFNTERFRILRDRWSS